MVPSVPGPRGVSVKLSPTAAVPADNEIVADSPAAPDAGYAIAISAPEAGLRVPEAMIELLLDNTLKAELEVNWIEIGCPNWLAGTRTALAGNAVVATG